jgi:hypothetical protein
VAAQNPMCPDLFPNFGLVRRDFLNFRHIERRKGVDQVGIWTSIRFNGFFDC